MGRGRPTFKQTDVTRAVRAIQATGAKIARVEIDPAGKITVVIADTATQAEKDDEAEFQQWLKEQEDTRKAR